MSGKNRKRAITCLQGGSISASLKGASRTTALCPGARVGNSLARFAVTIGRASLISASVDQAGARAGVSRNCLVIEFLDSLFAGRPHFPRRFFDVFTSQSKLCYRY